MSLFSKLGRTIKKRILPAAVGFLSGGPAGAIAGVLGTINRGGGARIQNAQSALPLLGLPALAGAARAVLPAVVRSLPGLGRVAGGALATAGRGAGALVKRFPRSARALAELGLIAVGGFVFDAAGNMVGRRAPAKRINPMNVRAARRAIRRIKGVNKICNDIQRCMPKRAVKSCAPAFGRKRK